MHTAANITLVTSSTHLACILLQQLHALVTVVLGLDSARGTNRWIGSYLLLLTYYKLTYYKLDLLNKRTAITIPSSTNERGHTDTGSSVQLLTQSAQLLSPLN